MVVFPFLPGMSVIWFAPDRKTRRQVIAVPDRRPG